MFKMAQKNMNFTYCLLFKKKEKTYNKSVLCKTNYTNSGL